MTKDPFDAALDGFERWTATTQRKLNADPEAAVGEVESLLDLMRDYLDIESPAGLGEGDLRELLLQIYPRKMTVFDQADIEDTVPAARDLVAYLADRGQIDIHARVDDEGYAGLVGGRPGGADLGRVGFGLQ